MIEISSLRWRQALSSFPSSGTARTHQPTLKSDGQPVADSREIAARFGKLHDHVLRAIDNLLKSLVPDFSGAGFVEMSEFDPRANKPVRYFLLTRKACSLVTMRFTGAEAL
ncbi:Rha family transcriptional regulator [Methylocapsa sp. D3K7]|uniref:Rha family transcriptional regulator n=1 Tax=Methylocapsa sp. D3K7 TaxID=3041435 RepID=UPI00244E7813|nr:Rha family transcriptional regulator [Methylocapsa sp. D3K7]WGJ13784.1 Rha family transcriptional regulator [Methylocapsa sp. D3K7]